MIIINIGYNHCHDSDFFIDRPNGSGDYLLLLLKTDSIFNLNGEDVHVPMNSFFIYKKGKESSVDVKDERKKHRYDSDTAEKVMWVEIKNVKGDAGWLYGKADYIAFKHIDGFIMVKRVDLIKLLDEKRLKWDDGRYKKGRNFYETYTRDGRKDEIVMFPICDILTIKKAILE